MYEDEFLEADYEDRYTIQADYDIEDDLDFGDIEDEYGICDICGDPIDYCPGHGYESDMADLTEMYSDFEMYNTL